MSEQEVVVLRSFIHSTQNKHIEHYMLSALSDAVERVKLYPGTSQNVERAMSTVGRDRSMYGSR